MKQPGHLRPEEAAIVKDTLKPLHQAEEVLNWVIRISPQRAAMKQWLKEQMEGKHDASS